MLTPPRILIGGMLAITAVLAIGAAGWWFFIREDNSLATSAPAIPTDIARTATPASGGGASTLSSSSGGQTFTLLSERSEAAYFADEKLASLPLPSTAKGTTKGITGSFHLTEDGLGLDPSQPSTFTVNLKTLKSDKDMRDTRVQNQALETATYPTATFSASSVSGYDPSIPAGQEQSLKLTGILDLHGVRKEVTWDVKARRDGDVITGLATVNFKYADFNIPQLNIANFVSVQDNVTLQVQIVAQRG